MFIDTHCHLDAAEFMGQQDFIVDVARSAGVVKLVLPAIERANFDCIKKLCSRFLNCFPAYGIHPMFVNHASPADFNELRNYLAEANTVAIGEIGLDFFIPNYDQNKQEFYFAEQLRLAREVNLPVLLHTRRAHDIVLKHLRQIKVCGGIAHAFNGSTQQADEFIKLGFKLGLGGAITYSRATRLHKLARTLPLEYFVLETDSPDMPPSFLDYGEVNKPEYVPCIAQKLAELRGMSLEEIAKVTTANALVALPKLSLYDVLNPI